MARIRSWLSDLPAPGLAVVGAMCMGATRGAVLFSCLGCQGAGGSRVATGLGSPVPGEVGPAGFTAMARASHSATLLPNGHVLIAGGMGAAGTTAELYDPGPKSFSSAGRLAFERAGGHAAVLLRDGTVLLIGGWTGGAVAPTAELFNPATGSFAATGSMATARSAFTATRLPSGNVLIAGGFDGRTRLASAEIYDPAMRAFLPTGNMSHPRAEHAAAVLPDGRVLVTGGNRAAGDVVADAEIYDPASGRFVPAGRMTVVRHKHAATALRDGRVLITGGSDARDWRGRHASAELYDPATGRFEPAARMHAERFKIPHAVVRLPTGQVLVAGGAGRAELYDPATGDFRTAAGEIGLVLAFSTATLLRDSSVLIVGGYDLGIVPTARVWIYRP